MKILPVNVWTVNDEEDMLRMIDIGCGWYYDRLPCSIKRAL